MTMTAFSDDFIYSLRLLRRAPGFSLAALLALALGIGANTAIFSVVDAVLLSPLPYADADRLAMVWEDASSLGFPRNTPSPANWADWRNQNTVFTDIAASRGTVFSLTGDGDPEQVAARRTTASLWTVLRTPPMLGRTFSEDEEKAGTALAVISYGLWERRYGGDLNVVGRKILLSGNPYTVTGVMPRTFVFPNRGVDIWVPAAFTPQELSSRGSHYLQCVARLKPGVQLAEAQAEMSGIMKRLEAEYPRTNRQIGVAVIPMREQITGTTRPMLIALMCAAGCVLLIACANIANLLLARGSEREREMAVRSAMGAVRQRLIRQLLTESLVLALLGAGCGLIVARSGLSVLQKLTPEGMAAVTLQLDWRILLFAIVVSICTGALFGMAPAFAGTRLDLNDALKQGGRGSAGPRRNTFRDGLVVVQVALALVLLTGAGLMIQTLIRLQQVDLGLRTDHLLIMNTYPAANRYPDHPRRVAFVDAVLDRVRQLPGVVNAGYTSNLPLTTQGNSNGYILKGQSEQEARSQDALFRVVTPDFFPTMGAKLKEGRFFMDTDSEKAVPVVIVNETFASLHFRGQSALGKQLQINHRGVDQPWLEIVGVVKEVRERGIDVETKPAIYMPHAQSAGEWPIPGDLAIRTSVAPLSMAAAVRQAIWDVDKDQPIARLRTMDALAEETLAGRRESMTLLAVFAGLALLLAIIGIYGVLSYTVLQRSREIAVRMAMGARPAQVLGMIASRGLGLTGLGLAIGLAASLAATRWIRTMLFEVRERDPWTLAAVSALLAVVALAACLVPARRASRIDPSSALRND
jgi:putative ABC transport system permease protein